MASCSGRVSFVFSVLPPSAGTLRLNAARTQTCRQSCRNACAGRPTLTGLQCRQTLSRELHNALSAQHREEYARARSGRVLAMVPTYPA